MTKHVTFYFVLPLTNTFTRVDITVVLKFFPEWKEIIPKICRCCYDRPILQVPYFQGFIFLFLYRSLSIKVQEKIQSVAVVVPLLQQDAYGYQDCAPQSIFKHRGRLPLWFLGRTAIVLSDKRLTEKKYWRRRQAQIEFLVDFKCLVVAKIWKWLHELSQLRKLRWRS